MITKIGRKTKANIKARRKIAEICENLNLNYCELGLEGCLRYMFLAPAHKHPRVFYNGDVEKLADYHEWIVCCSACHARLDDPSIISKEEKENIFKRLRP